MSDKGRPFEVAFEDNHLLIVNKKPGILVQSDSTGDIPLVEYAKNYIKEKYSKPGLVFLETTHRIDRPASGLVILARTSKGLERMNKIFKNKEIQKTYWAVVETRPGKTSDHLENWLIKDRIKNKSAIFKKEKKGSVKAQLDYKLIGEIGGNHLLEINLQTGRPHQIRAQLAFIGCPIKGDIKYGAPSPNSDGNICLHHRRVAFLHPVRNTPLDIKAPPFDTEEWRMFINFGELD